MPANRAENDATKTGNWRHESTSLIRISAPPRPLSPPPPLPPPALRLPCIPAWTRKQVVAEIPPRGRRGSGAHPRGVQKALPMSAWCGKKMAETLLEKMALESALASRFDVSVRLQPGRRSTHHCLLMTSGLCESRSCKPQTSGV